MIFAKDFDEKVAMFFGTRSHLKLGIYWPLKKKFTAGPPKMDVVK